MQTTSISTILSQEIAFLPLIQQQQVLDYVRKLKAATHASSVNNRFASTIEKQASPHIVGKPMKLAEFREKFVGMFSKEDLEIMAQVIEEDCGRVDLEDW